MSGRFAAWLRVAPSPSTLAESSAIFRHLKSKGRVTAFTKDPRDDNKDASTALYFTTFAHEPLGLRPDSRFDVQVYHNEINLRDQDPFDIRGLQSRKPLPEPMTFSCHVERMNEAQQRAVENTIKSKNRYHGHFKVQKRHEDWLQEAVSETGAPAAIAKALGQLVGDTKLSDTSQSEENKQSDGHAANLKEVSKNHGKSSLRANKRRLRMDSLIHRADSD